LNRKILFRFAKILIGILCFTLIAQRLYISYSPQNLASVKEIFSHFALLSFTFLLLFLNWGIEVQKWKMITSPIEKISFGKAWQSVWTGVCIGNLTPGRVGEFAGRMLFFSVPNRAKIATTHFICGITQLVITVVAGCTGMLLLSKTLDQGFFFITLGGEIFLLLLLLIGLYRINNVLNWLLRNTFLRKFNFEGLSYERSLLVKLLLLSVIRYFIFSFQFYLLLLCCGISGDVLKVCAAISITYLLLSTIPMISFIEVGVRAYVTVLLFSSFGINEWQLSTVSTLLWFINLAVPSVVGYVFILWNNFSFNREKNELA
jgi:hypothetical protein